MRKNHSILAVIPARGGSKGIPRKNLRKIGPHSLVGHSIMFAQTLPWIDRIVLSTDDAEIAAEGKKYGLDVPFLRPAALATDTATGADAWKQAWQASEQHWKTKFDISILLQPTSPFRNTADMERMVDTMINGGYAAATSISRVPGHYTPQKTLTMDERQVVHFLMADGAKHSNRQSIPAYYTRNGLYYCAWRSTLVDKGQIIEENCVGILINGTVVNIDEPIDLEWAEFIFQRNQQQNKGHLS